MNFISILRALDPDAVLYLYEPGQCLEEPKWSTTTFQLVTTCSPDDRRYKEMKKNGGILYYMPTWTLNELLLVGKHLRTHVHEPEVDFSETAIKERYFFL